MKSYKKLLLSTLLLLPFLAVFPCTTFVYSTAEGQLFFGRNFDFPAGMGHIEINKANTIKSSMAPEGEAVFSWVSRFGSISFNQIGREFPYGGMNEAGLIIEQMWHQEAKYPEKDSRAALSELQWIQYQLDMAESVEDIIDSDRLVRIADASIATLHFLVADASGTVATIEFFEGEMVVHKGENLPYKVLANCSYEVSVDFVGKKQEDNNAAFSPWVENSSGRFATAASLLDKMPAEESAVDGSFNVLQAVAQKGQTQWSIVYDQANRCIFFRTMANDKLREIKLDDFDFRCESPDYFLDIDANPQLKENIKVFNESDNFELINGVCNAVEFLSRIPVEYRKATAIYPHSMSCADN
ncbi:MAG: linear amide C-N hydrolase [Bacteroidetes bacterium]|jgi:penicillin V acylase-like amidase (Ntn superfamily)|nr:linear amide C-N hydrolase [Bacteroidota bacterium]